jgi:cellulose synthase operon protein C
VVRSRLAGLTADWSKAMGEANVAKAFPGDDAVVLEQFASTRAQADERLTAATQLTELDGQRAEGWLLRGLAETDAAAKRTSFLKALELDPQLVAAAAELARVSTGTEAIDFARKAFGEVATARALSTSAEVLSRSGLCGEALSLELRALETLSHAAERTVGAKLHARLDALAKCAR